VIAKRGRSEQLLVERTIYENVLPRLDLLALRYHGFVSEEDDAFAWLFVEDAGDTPCSLAKHRTLAARWLGALHGATTAIDLPPLPERGPEHYLAHLSAARATILDNFDNPALYADDRRTLTSLVLSCDVIEYRWSGVETICDRLPRTLIHGDLVDRHLRLKSTDGKPALVALDWEWSGSGVPAADVHLLASGAPRNALVTYRSAMSEYTGALDEDQIRLLSLVGKGFRLLASVDWACTHLAYPRPQKGMATLRVYEQPLREWAEGLAVAA
jgi:hypothetical protein